MGADELLMSRRFRFVTSAAVVLTASVGIVPFGGRVATAAGAPWTLPTVPPTCTQDQADSGDVAGCVITNGDGLPELLGWPAPPFPDPQGQVVSPWVDLTIGASGPTVARVQTALIAGGGSVSADGLFGQRTADAVTAYQTLKALPATGIVDVATANSLGVQNLSGGTWPPSGWKWLGWGYNGSAALAAWERQLISNPIPIGSMKKGQLVAFADALPLFMGFYAEIQARGYVINDGGTYVFRCTASTRKDCAGLTRAALSNHAYGLASDINTIKNPQRAYYGVNGASACATPMVTDLPKWVVDAAQKWGLYWGGYGWSSGCSSPSQSRASVTRDAMHFEFNGSPTQAHMILRRNVGAGACINLVTELGQPLNWCMLNTDVPPAMSRIAISTNAPAGATTALVNIAATGVLGPGYLTAEDCGPRPNGVRGWSNGNVRVGRTSSWATIVPIDAQGRFCIYQSSAFHTVVDVQGFFSPSAAAPTGNLFTPMAARRTMDTRSQTYCLPDGSCIAPSLVGPTIVTTNTVPSTISPVAMLANLTVTEATKPGYLTADACSALTPGPQTHSNVNYTNLDLSITNLGVVPATATDMGVQFCTFTNQLVHEVVDVLGLFAPPDQGGLGYTTLTPTRLIDTRECRTDPVTLVQQCGVANAPGRIIHLIAPAGTTVAVVNVTAVDPVAKGLVTAASCSTFANHGFASPVVQAVANTVVANLAVIPVDPDGSYCIASTTTTHLVVDQVGSFSATGDLRFVPISPNRVHDSRPPG